VTPSLRLDTVPGRGSRRSEGQDAHGPGSPVCPVWANCRVSQMSNIEITAAVLTYNAAERIEACLQALMNQTRRAEDVVVVDNGSTDETLAIVRQRFPSVRIVAHADNAGCSGGRNRQLEAALHRHVLVVDDDAFLAPDCIAELERHVGAQPEAVWTPRVCYEQDPGLIQFDGSEVHFLGETVLTNPDRRLDDVREPASSAQLASALAQEPSVLLPLPISIAGGITYLIDRDAVRAVGGYDESYFFGRADTELSFRLTLAGYRILSIRSARVYHRVKERGFTYLRNQIRNRWMLILIGYSWRTIAVLIPAFLAYEVMLLAFLTLKGRSRDYFAANAELLTQLPAILAKRRRLQAIKQRRDRNVLSGGAINIRADVAGNWIYRRLHALVNAGFRSYWAFTRVLCG
jgi:GT2 family glycosyltransferase